MTGSNVRGKVALVTGAARGIGLATVIELARQGVFVIAGVRHVDSVDKVLAHVAEDVRAQLWVTPCDVTNYEAVAATVEAGIARFGGIDFLINNAGIIAPIAAIANANPSEWAENIAVNLTGTLYCCRAALPHLLQRDSGVIVNISSGAALRPLEGWSAYCAAKAGVAMLTRSLALELAGSNVRVYGLRPGVVDTDMQAQIRASGVNEVSQLRRDMLLDPRVPARAVAWLCSDDAGDLAGQELDVRDEELRRRAGLERV